VHTDEVFFRDTAHGFLVWAVGLVMAVAVLASAASSLLGGAAVLGGAAATTAGAAVAGGAAAQMRGTSGTAGDASTYFVDSLFRTDRATADNNSARTDTPARIDSSNAAGAPAGSTGSSTAASTSTNMDSQRGDSGRADPGTRAEVLRILANGLTRDEFPAADKAYLVQLVATRTGMSTAEADKRVSNVLAQAQRAKAEALQAADDARKAASRIALWSFLALLVGAFTASFAATIGGRQRDRVPAL